MRRTSILALVLSLVLGACGGETASTTSDVGDPPATPASSTTVPATATDDGSATTTDTETQPTSEPSDDDLAVFIAAMEELLTGTVYEEGALEEPELFLATGYLFCEWLDDGADADGVITRYLDELAGGVDSATDEQLVLTGALLGSAVGVLCPHHADAVAQD